MRAQVSASISLEETVHRSALPTFAQSSIAEYAYRSSRRIPLRSSYFLRLSFVGSVLFVFYFTFDLCCVRVRNTVLLM